MLIDDEMCAILKYMGGNKEETGLSELPFRDWSSNISHGHTALSWSGVDNSIRVDLDHLQSFPRLQKVRHAMLRFLRST